MEIDFEQKLNKEQYAAMISQSLTKLILASARTGKTRTLSSRMAWLIMNVVSVDNILFFTFTNKADKEILQWMEELTGFRCNLFYGEMHHHICQHLLQYQLENLNFVIPDEIESLMLFNCAIKSIYLFCKDKNKNKNQNKINRWILYEILSYSRNMMQSLSNVIEDNIAI
jgi:DNA helicase-2/ATP-dependent DNA helicase PcrA